MSDTNRPHDGAHGDNALQPDAAAQRAADELAEFGEPSGDVTLPSIAPSADDEEAPQVPEQACNAAAPEPEPESNVEAEVGEDAVSEGEGAEVRVMQLLEGLNSGRNAARHRGQRIAIAAPRGHAKSTLVTLASVLWTAVHQKDHLILIVSATLAQAVEHLRHIRDELDQNERLHRDFPEFAPGPRRATPWRGNMLRLPNGVTIRAAGSGQQIRGLRAGKHRPSLIIADDLEMPEHIASADQRQKLTEWFTSTLLKCGDERTNVIVIGTVLHYDALGFVAAAWPDTPDRVVVSMFADRWGNDATLPSDEEYVQAEDLALPLLRIAGRLLGNRLRLVQPPPDRVRPLRGVLAEALRGVTRSHQVWAHPQRKVHGLHPSEQECFWRFIRVAHQVRSVLRPRDVAHHLVAAGFHPAFAQQLAREYQVGRQVLTVFPEPWNLRRLRKERRRTRRAELERELPSSP